MVRITIVLMLMLGGSLSAAEKSKKVLIIGLDGVRPDALKKAKAPNLHELIKQGAYSDNNDILGPRKTKADTVSGPGWSSIVTGVWSDKHKVLNNRFVPARSADFPPVFQLLKQEKPNAVFGAICSWKPLAEKIFTKNCNAKHNGKAKNDPLHAADAKTVDQAVKLLAKPDIDMAFIYFGHTDSAGHKYGFHPTVPEYMKAINTVDGYIGRMRKAIAGRATAENEDWLILVCTDHGGYGKGHGGGTKNIEIRNTFLIVSGSSVKPQKIKEQTGNVDVVRTALAHLGIQPRKNWKLDGKVRGIAP